MKSDNVKGFCCPNETIYTDPQIRQLILAKFSGINFAGKREGYQLYAENKTILRNSLAENGSVMNIEPDPNLRCYIDEPISTPDPYKNLPVLLGQFANSIIGELTKENLSTLRATYPKASFTYTSYREWWFTIPFTNLRIYKWWKNQTAVWEWMEKNFGGKETISSTDKIAHPDWAYAILPSCFKICWINLQLNRNDIKQLTQWAESHQKEVWYYCEIATSKEDLIKALGAL